MPVVSNDCGFLLAVAGNILFNSYISPLSFVIEEAFISSTMSM